MTWYPAPQPPCPCCGPELAETKAKPWLSEWERAMYWPDVDAETIGNRLPDAELRQQIEDTDPAPVEEPRFEPYQWTEAEAAAKREWTAAQPRPSFIDRIRNATRRNT